MDLDHIMQIISYFQLLNHRTQDSILETLAVQTTIPPDSSLAMATLMLALPELLLELVSNISAPLPSTPAHEEEPEEATPTPDSLATNKSSQDCWELWLALLLPRWSTMLREDLAEVEESSMMHYTG